MTSMAEPGRKGASGRRKFAPNVALKNFRELAGLSQEALARASGVQQSAITRLENGLQRTTAEIAARLAPHLGRTPRDLFPGPLPPSVDEDEPDRDVMTRAVVAARRLVRAAGNEDLLVELIAPIYALLLREQNGHPITDDDRTLSIIESLITRLRHFRPAPPASE